MKPELHLSNLADAAVRSAWLGAAPDGNVAMTDDAQSNTGRLGVVVQELQKGYLLDGRVLRPSMVKVAQ